MKAERGQVWLTRAGWYVLLMSQLTERVWNIAMWPESEGADVIPGPSAQASMVADDVLTYDGWLVEQPSPEVIAAIEDAYAARSYITAPPSDGRS